LDAEQLMVKFYVEDPSRLDLGELIPIFHDWIRNHRLDELLIDVADYRHVHDGPGVILVCSGAIYGMDQGDGRLGLLYTRKHMASGPPESRIEAAFRAALTACVKLEEEPSLKGRIKFRGNEASFRLIDRLNAPNTPETLAAIRPELEGFLNRLYAGSQVKLTHRSDPRQMFTVDIAASGPFDVSSLLGRLR
jgi:hypothetical protein